MESGFDNGDLLIKGDRIPPPPYAISEVANLQEDLDSKVDKIEGKGLSTNDFTTVLLNYLNRTVHTGAARSIVTSTSGGGFQLSESNIADAFYTISLSTTSTIGGSATRTILAEVAPTNSSTPGDWVEYARIAASQTITLALALQSVQVTTFQLAVKDIPAGYYVRLRETSSGTGVSTFISGREVY